MFKNVSDKQNKSTLKSATKNINKFDDFDDDTIVSRTDDLLYARNFEYTIEFQDKSKNYDVVIQHKKIFNNKKDNFENFANQITSEVVKNFK